ncbi:MAG: cobalt ECF transporter T component CbiQ [Bacteroidales bacterium]|nr:cobalt ECF transporter T component CbiQ [Bacteroidales bacterium]
MTLVLREHPIPDSPLARWDARWKLAAFLLAAFALVATQTALAAGAGWLLTLGLAGIARIPVRTIIQRVLLIFVAVLPVLLVAPLSGTATDAGWQLGTITISQPRLLVALAVVLRAFGIGTLALVLVRTDPLPRLLTAAHALFLPGVLIQIAALAYRYTFLLASEARRMQIALRTRGFRPRTNAHTYSTLGSMIGGVLVRGSDRADAVSAAMRCRGFDGNYHSLSEFQSRNADRLNFLILALAFGSLLLVERFL